MCSSKLNIGNTTLNIGVITEKVILYSGGEGKCLEMLVLNILNCSKTKRGRAIDVPIIKNRFIGRAERMKYIWILIIVTICGKSDKITYQFIVILLIVYKENTSGNIIINN